MSGTICICIFIFICGARRQKLKRLDLDSLSGALPMLIDPAAPSLARSERFSVEARQWSWQACTGVPQQWV